MFRNYLWLAFLLSGISIGTSSVMIYFFVQNITPEKEGSDGNAIYQAERHGESLLTILKENLLRGGTLDAERRRTPRTHPPP